MTAPIETVRLRITGQVQGVGYRFWMTRHATTLGLRGWVRNRTDGSVEALVIGEDLGTVPEGFRDELGRQGVLGMQVLWFERDHTGHFIGPGRWRRDAAAMTTTHDLPTVAGWWSGHDIDWRARLERLRIPEDEERNERAADRERL